jgi:methyltransferase-like protein 6
MERIQLNGTEKLVNNAHKYWDKFYLKNQNRFFKDRHWVIKEWPELAPNGQVPILDERLLSCR